MDIVNIPSNLMLLSKYAKHKIEYALSRKNRDYVPFLILGNGRTGTNRLVSSLQSQSNICCFNEVFHQHLPILGYDFMKFDRVKEMDVVRRNDVKQFIDRDIYKKYPLNIDAVGLKLIYWHAEGDSWQKNIVSNLLKIDRLRVIHQKRVNLLDQYVSAELAWKTGKWVGTKNETGENVQLIIDPIHFQQKIKKIKELELKYTSLFQDVPMLEITYEDTNADFEGVMKKVESFLNTKFNVPIVVKTNKQKKCSNKDIIKNYHELQSFFQDTSLNYLFK